MSLLYFDSLHEHANLPHPEFTSDFGAVTTGRDGVANGASGSGGGTVRELALPSAAATCILGTACNLLNLSTNICPIIFCSATGTGQLFLTVNTSGFIEVRTGSATGTLLGTSSGHTAISASQWRHFAMKANLATGTGGNVVVQLDGVTVLTLTGVATSAVTGNVTHIRFQPNTGTNNTYWDDLYVCDAVDATATQGRPNNDFLGDIGIPTLLPNADGDSAQWTCSTGTDHYALVDENPVNTTDYVSDSTSGHRDLYQMTDAPSTPQVVYGIRATYYAQKSDSGTVTIKPCLKENGTVTTESAQGLQVGQFGVIHGALRYKRPSDSAVWATTDVAALQIGQEVG